MTELMDFYIMENKNKNFFLNSFVTYLSVPGCIETTILLIILLLFFAVIYSITLDGNLLSWISAIGGFLAAIVSLITLIFAVVQVKKWHQNKVDDFRLEKLLEVYIYLDTLPNLYNNYKKVKKYAETRESNHKEGKKSKLLEKVLMELNNRVFNSEKHIIDSLDKLQLSFDKYIGSTKFILKNDTYGVNDKLTMKALYTLMTDSFIDDVNEMFDDLEKQEKYVNMRSWVQNQRTILEVRKRF